MFVCFRPLDEPKKLKEKFDAIFSATKYIKCLDAIRNTRKKYLEGEGILQFFRVNAIDVLLKVNIFLQQT